MEVRTVVYIRAKKTKTDAYLYLVKSVWDKERNTSKQEIIKYLGKASEVSREDIPVDHRDDPKIIAVLTQYNPKNLKMRDSMIRKSRQILFQSLLEGDIERSECVYSDYAKTTSAGDFFEKILRPVMYMIGDGWKAGKISIASEHVASNTAQTLIRSIFRRTPERSAKAKVLICVPAGEEHHLGCDMLEVLFSIKGFKVFNMKTPVPTRSILDFIGDNRPDCVLVSVTLEENLVASQRMVKKIRMQYDMPIFVGGYAVQSGKIPAFQAEVIRDIDLEYILKKIQVGRAAQSMRQTK